MKYTPLVKLLIEDAMGSELTMDGSLSGYVDKNGELHNSDIWEMYLLDNVKAKYIRYGGYLYEDAAICIYDKNYDQIDAIVAENGSTITELLISLPENTYAITFSCLKSYKIRLMEFESEPNDMDVTDFILNVDEIETTHSRDDTSGVMDTVSFPIELGLDGADYLKNIFYTTGLYSSYRMSLYKRGDHDNNYTVIKSAFLDFSTYKEYEYKVQIEYAEAELTEIINSEGKTKYEIPVSEVMALKKWHYERMDFINNAIYELSNSDMTTSEETDQLYLSIYLSKSELVPGEAIDFKSQALSYNDADYFVKNAGDSLRTINVQMKFGIVFAGSLFAPFGFHDLDVNSLLSIVLLKFNSENVGIVVKEWFLLPQYAPEIGNMILNGTFSTQVNFAFEHILQPGDKLSFAIKVKKLAQEVYIQKGSIVRFETIDDESYIRMNYIGKNRIAHDIAVIRPEILIQRYLNEMSGHRGMFSASIEWMDDEYRTLIVPADSIRKMPEAKIYGSPNDFFNWMKVLGYEYECIGRNLVFKKRDDFFQRGIVAMYLKESEVADLIVQANGEYAYTSVEIGYEKQDYESMNGRCEANGTFSYTTGYITREDNKLSLISPYRADSIGIELLCQESDKETTDNKSDNDVFFVALKENSDNYTEYKGIVIEDKEVGLKMFNAPFNPYFLIKRNESLIGINAREVKFKSTDASRSAQITGIDNIYSDQKIEKKLFEPIEYNFSAGSWKNLPSENVRNGLINFKWQDNTLKGFIKQVRKNYVADTETTWELWAVK